MAALLEDGIGISSARHAAIAAQGMMAEHSKVFQAGMMSGPLIAYTQTPPPTAMTRDVRSQLTLGWQASWQQRTSSRSSTRFCRRVHDQTQCTTNLSPGTPQTLKARRADDLLQL